MVAQPPLPVLSHAVACQTTAEMDMDSSAAAANRNNAKTAERDRLVSVTLQMAGVLDGIVDAAYAQVATARAEKAEWVSEAAASMAARAAARSIDASTRTAAALAAKAASAAATAAKAEAAYAGGSRSSSSGSGSSGSRAPPSVALRMPSAPPSPPPAPSPAPSPLDTVLPLNTTTAALEDGESAQLLPLLPPPMAPPAGANSAVAQQVTELALRLQAARAVQAANRSTTPRRRRFASAALGALAAHRKSNKSGGSPRTSPRGSPRGSPRKAAGSGPQQQQRLISKPDTPRKLSSSTPLSPRDGRWRFTLRLGRSSGHAATKSDDEEEEMLSTKPAQLEPVRALDF